MYNTLGTMGGEREIDITSKFLKRLSQFYTDKDALQEALDTHLPDATSKQDLFRRLTEGLGTPDTHDSGKPEGKMRGS